MFGAGALGSGITVYLLGTVAFARVVGMPTQWIRLVAALAIAGSIPLLAVVTPMVALAVVVVVVAIALSLDGVRRYRMHAMTVEAA